MTRRVAVHQPHYLPWLGLIEKIALVDEFILLDDVQFTRRNFQHRTRYPTDNGPKWLSIPVRDTDSAGRRLTINELTYGEPKAVVFRKHLETLSHRYASAPGWPAVRERLRAMYERHAESDLRPVDLMIESMELTLDLFEIPGRLRLASGFHAPGKRDVHNMELTRAVGGTIYVSGQGSKAYMRDGVFGRNGVSVEYQEFAHPEYKQRHGGAFVPGCWALDFLLCAPDDALAFAQAALTRNRADAA